MSSLQLSEGLREDVPVEVRRRPVVTLQGAADAERVVNSLGKNRGRFAVEVLMHANMPLVLNKPTGLKNYMDGSDWNQVMLNFELSRHTNTRK